MEVEEKASALYVRAEEIVLTHGIDLATNVAIFLLILLASKIVIGSVSGWADSGLKKSGKVSDTLRPFLINVLCKVLWVIALMVALPRLGVEVAPLVAGLGVTGFVLGFAFKDSLGNLASGIMLLLNEPFKVGDVVEAAGHTGCVKELNMMATIMATGDNKKIVIPNSSVWGGAITNFTANDTRRVDLAVGIGYGCDISKARDVIKGVIGAHELVIKDQAVVVELVEMADSSLNFVVRSWAKTSDYWTVYWQLNQQIKEALDANDIEIPFPQRVIHQAS